MNKKSKKTWAVILCMIILLEMLSFCALGCSSPSSGSSSQKTYTCGYCGKTMKGGYYDYINGKYACRSCSKRIRG